MAKILDGDSLCDVLKEQLGAKNDSDLAAKINVTPARVSQLRRSKSVSALQLARYFKSAVEHKVGDEFLESINPIVEFFPTENFQPQKKRHYPFNYKSNDILREKLKGNGLYAFHNSEGRIIYLGKAKKQELFNEIVQTYNRSFTNYKIQKVNHQPSKRKGNFDLRLRKSNICLYETAAYFSAYEIAADLIDPLESFAIRIIPNNVINTKMERSLKHG
jgi:hypothetical protein